MLFEKNKSAATIFLLPSGKAFRAIARDKKTVNWNMEELEFDGQIEVGHEHKSANSVNFMVATNLSRGTLQDIPDI